MTSNFSPQTSQLRIDERNHSTPETLMRYPAVPKAFGTRYLISPLPRGEGMKGRELFGNPDAEHRGIL
jgi:hypothetical protein